MPEISFLSGLMTSTAAAATATSHTLSHTTDATLEPMLEHVCRTYFEDIQTAAPLRHHSIFQHRLISENFRTAAAAEPV